MSRQLIIKLIAFGLIGGLVIFFNQVYWLLFLSPLLLFFPIRFSQFLILITAVGLGIISGQLAGQIAPNNISNFVTDQPQAIVGVINREVLVMENQQKTVLKIVQIDDISASGYLQIILPWGWPYQVGDKLSFTCWLSLPKDARQQRQWRRWRVTAACFKPYGVNIITGDQFSFYKIIFSFKEKLRGQIKAVLPEPHSSLLGGLLWGGGSSLPPVIQNEFRIAGMSHQIAVSGFNTTIIAAAIMALFFNLRISRRLSTSLAAGSLILFVILTGATASVIRAALMSILVLIARALGRLSSAGYSLWLVSLTMALLNPWLIYDVGWQLSLAATAGLIYLSPIIKPYLNWLPVKFGIQESLTSTLAATIITIPVMAAHFGQISVIGLLANMFTLPLVPLIMASGAVTIVISFIWPLFDQAVGLISWLLLSYLLAIPHWLAKVPMAALVMPPLGYWSFIMYGPLLYFLKQKFQTICPLK